jgi:meso-butanediol dehydrogenase/(S,S)-butanediol dehydrogenase/diacetyl reductase
MGEARFPELAGAKAVVTGGANGIGKAIAAALSRQSATVTIADVDLTRAEQAAMEIGGFSVEIDVRKRGSVEAALAAAEAHMGGFDLLVANAGVSTMQHALEITDEEWDYNFDVNVRGIFLANQIAARGFKARGRGVIVNTASLAAKIGAPLLAHYSASKFAVLGWTQALARELAPSGIRVNAVCPGFVKTGMQEREIAWEARLRDVSPERVVADYIAQTPLGRLETPEDVADVVVFLCSDSARFMTGQGVNVTGGVYMT